MIIILRCWSIFAALPAEEVQRRKQAADLSFLNQGITFTVYGRDEGTERIFPYDMLPRIITAAEWAKVEEGPHATHYCAESVSEKISITKAASCRTGIVPRELVYSCPQFSAADARSAGAAQCVCGDLRD